MSRYTDVTGRWWQRAVAKAKHEDRIDQILKDGLKEYYRPNLTRMERLEVIKALATLKAEKIVRETRKGKSS